MILSKRMIDSFSIFLLFSYKIHKYILILEKIYIKSEQLSDYLMMIT